MGLEMSESSSSSTVEARNARNESDPTCAVCGHRSREADAFCRSCGSDLDASVDERLRDAGYSSNQSEPPGDAETLRHRSQRRKRWTKHVVAVLLLVGLGTAAELGLRTASWNALLDRTAHVDDAELWQPYMEVSYCEINLATTEDDLYLWSFDASREVTILKARLETRVQQIEDLYILPWHTDLLEARSAILAHYDVWMSSLDAEERFLTSAELEDDIYNGYLDTVVPFDDHIAATFEAARDSYYQAEPSWVSDTVAIESAFLDAGEVAISCDGGGQAA